MEYYNAFNIIVGVWGGILFTFAVAELVTLRGNCFNFSLGAAAAIVAYYAGLDIPLQVAAFAVVAALSFLLLRPLFRKRAARNATRHEEGLDLLVGHEGKVIAKVDLDAGTGRVEIGGRPAKAVPANPRQKYNVGDRVVAISLDGDKLVVEKRRKRK